MPYAKLAVDGHTLLDGDLGDWQQKHPAEFANLIQPAGQHQPWLSAAIGVLATAALAGRNTSIDIHIRTDSWMMTVSYPS